MPQSHTDKSAKDSIIRSKEFASLMFNDAVNCVQSYGAFTLMLRWHGMDCTGNLICEYLHWNTSSY